MNIAASDSIVGEYLIYRGFTQTYRSLETERRRDKTRQFEVHAIVDAIFTYLNGFEILNFVSLWDFMNKRFFVHLDMDHIQISNEIKSDLLKYYLVHAVKVKEKEKIVEFFQMYSHEILNESGGSNSLRSWYSLPYLDQPQEDHEFSVYFSIKWFESLKFSLNNFLSIVLSTTPPPKLLLLERWYRSEAQQEIRLQLQQSFQKVDILAERLEKNEHRIISLHQMIKELSLLLMKASSSDLSRGGSVGLFETDKEAEERRIQVKDIGQMVSKLANDCCNKGKEIESLDEESQLREILGNQVAIQYFGATIDPTIKSTIDTDLKLEEIENRLLQKLNQWLKLMST